MNTTAKEVFECFESSFRDRVVLPEELELIWLRRAIARYSIELDPLTFDVETLEFDCVLDMYVIDTLASILERRDIIEEEWDGEVIVEHTNRSGITNKEQSPALRLVNDLNRDALTYWKELGLTPASLKRINETAMKEKKKESALERALKSLA